MQSMTFCPTYLRTCVKIMAPCVLLAFFRHFTVLWWRRNLSSPNRAMQVCDAMCFCNPRCKSRDFRASDGTKTSDLCSPMCIAENHLCDAKHFHSDLRSRCGNPLRCRPRYKRHCECDVKSVFERGGGGWKSPPCHFCCNAFAN